MNSRSKVISSGRAAQNREAGFLTFSGILLFVIVGAILFAAFKLLPPYIDNYRMQDYLSGITRNATYNRMTEDDIRKDVLAEARQLDIPIEPNQVRVERSGPSVSVAIQYTVTVDLLVKQIDLEFAPAAGNRNILAKP
jgi:hypothetical protein